MAPAYTPEAAKPKSGAHITKNPDLRIGVLAAFHSVAFHFAAVAGAR
jgi:hypothetical protein